MKKISLLILGLLSVAKIFSQTEDSLFIKRLSDYILTQGKSYDDLRFLTKKIGGRLSGSQGMVKAEQWGLKTMQDAGADNAFLQECMVPHWVRGGKDEAVSFYDAKKKKTLDVIALGNSAGSMKPLSKQVIEVKSFADLASKKDEVKDKIVFFNVPFNSTYIKTFQAYRDAVPYRGAGASQAAKFGAAAVIVRSMSHSSDNFPHTGSLNYNDSFPKIPAVAIGLQDADWLSNQLKSGSVSVTLTTHGKFLPDTIGHNVVAELKGSEFPNEYITVGGHLDSWDPLREHMMMAQAVYKLLKYYGR